MSEASLSNDIDEHEKLRNFAHFLFYAQHTHKFK